MPRPVRRSPGFAGVFRCFAEVAERRSFGYRGNGEAARRAVDLVPIGPVLIITTWNFPVETVATHLAPALAAGCTAVVLANRNTPGSVAALFDLLAESSLPRGAVNLVMGRSSALSAHLLQHRAIRHVSYTGSVTVGRALAEQAGAQLKRATLELGGNAPAIVLPGSDLVVAARDYAGKRFWNAGQVCTAPNRIYVPRAQHDAFVEAVAAYAAGLKVGDGFDPASDMGPLANAGRIEAMTRFLADAREKDVRPATGGDPGAAKGNWWAPTVLGGVPEEALAMREEVFGPIACISPYDTVEEVVARANDCELGLSAYVYGPDQSEAEAVAARLQVGSVGVNQMVTAFIDMPFGGVKNSGLGTIGGETALDEYLFPRLTAGRP